ncbi:MAG: hypothetical protein D6710_04785 [Nitrospirae bacterium]|nr:MAG: hypothetical protein D6710_04785 [Nitrospirota bacterium]
MRKLAVIIATVLLVHFGLSGSALAELKKLKSQGIYVSFEARDERVEDLFKALSEEFSFNVNIPSTLASKTVSTSVRHMPIDRAIIRVFSLLNETNYKIEYSPTGMVSAVKVFTIETKKTDKTKKVTRGNYQRNNRRTYVRRPVRRVRRPSVYRESPVYYDDEFIDDEGYYPDEYEDRQYQPQRRTPFIPSDEGE